MEAGRKLADLHTNYENVKPYPVQIEANNHDPRDPVSFYRVEK